MQNIKSFLLLGTVGLASCGMLFPQPHTPSTPEGSEAAVEKLWVPPTCSPYTINGSGWTRSFVTNDGSAPLNYHSYATLLPSTSDIKLLPYAINNSGKTTQALPFFYFYTFRPILPLTGTPEGGGSATQVYIDTQVMEGLVYRAATQKFELVVNNNANAFRTISGTGVVSSQINSGKSWGSFRNNTFLPSQRLLVEAYLKGNITYKNEMVLANYQGQGSSPQKWFKVSMPYQEMVIKVTPMESYANDTYFPAENPRYYTVPVRGFTSTPDAEHRFVLRNELFYENPYDTSRGTTLSAGTTAFYSWLNTRKDFVLNWNFTNLRLAQASVDGSNNPTSLSGVRDASGWNLGSPSGFNAANCTSKTAQVYQSEKQVDHIMPAATQSPATLPSPKLSGPSVDSIKLRTVSSRDPLILEKRGTTTFVLKNTGAQTLTYQWNLDHDLVIDDGGQPDLMAPGTSRTFTVSAPCPAEPLTGRPVVDTYLQTLSLSTNDPTGSGYNAYKAIQVEVTCAANTLYGWSSGSTLYGSSEYPANSASVQFEPSNNPLGYFQTRLNPDLVYSNIKEVNPAGGSGTCQGATNRANNASRCFWAEVEANPAYQAGNTVAMVCARQLRMAAIVTYVNDPNAAGYLPASALYGTPTKEAEHQTAICNNPSLTIIGPAGTSETFRYTVRHSQGNRTYAVTEGGFDPDPGAFNAQAVSCAYRLHSAAIIWQVNEPGHDTGYPAASDLYGDETKAIHYGTLACNTPLMVISGDAVTSGSFQYTVKHTYGSQVFTVSESGVSPDPTPRTPETLAFWCSLDLYSATRIWNSEHDTGYPAASEFYGDATKEALYHTRHCNNPDLTITGAAVSSGPFLYTVTHRYGNLIYTLTPDSRTTTSKY
ncbi:hypothetical protein [Deinococcus roseus]|uniref:Ig-like domain-containing protein n=1 Tax=Deinococcus roseus TaxID=392414 RepID=A0ABQ2CTD8_9DEIO|nr:hypothetical protein [Deinococcus roseus]GGJ18754.1 hypothetical protein GCM10008938_01040 [Deinococcus roseus]